MNIKSTNKHYEYLIEKDNDPYHDSPEIQNYMNRWTGDKYFDHMDLDDEKNVLEIGVGTGRLARHVLEIGCKSFTGIDLSQSTIERAQVNLSKYDNINLIVEDILNIRIESKFDVIYSALTFMHIKKKKKAISSILDLLGKNGVMVVSLSNVEDEYLDFGTHQVRLYPNNIDEILEYISNRHCDIELVEKLKDNNNLIATIIKARKKS